MDQIFYTQCPVGHGLGASGGLQIKRIDPGYPLSSDLKHLGLRAFIGSTRSMAPRTLRYRRDGDVAEVAWLWPRDKEYETERGLWGRPGGHFSHGLRMTPEELALIEGWPAGLFDWPGWARQDLEPSRGEPPPPLSEGWPGRFRKPEFSTIADGLDARGETIAALLTATAEAVRGDRCVFLIDEPARLPGWIALLTFAMPPAMRPSLTFSTYHDRPEELPGFRLHGTIPAARPNRAALAGLGIVADLLGDPSFAPAVEPAPWATTIAGWIASGDGESEAAWRRVGALIGRAIAGGSVAPTEAWSDAWLDRIVGFEEALRSSGPPIDESGWDRLAGLATWSASTGLAGDWLRRRPAAWWAEKEPAADSPAARAALRVHSAMDPGADWAAAAAAWHRRGEPEERFSAVEAMLRAAEGPTRGSVLSAFFHASTEDAGDALLDRLEGHPAAPESIRLPLGSRRAVARAAEGGDRRPIQELLGRASAEVGAIRATLDAVEAELSRRPEAGPAAARALADLIQKATPEIVKTCFSWALGLAPDRAPAWLSAYLRRVLAHPESARYLRSLWARAADDARPALAVAVLSAARDPSLGRGPFVWAVESLLLKLPEASRPADPAWPSAYLRRVPSGYDLSRKLYLPATRDPELRRWIDEAAKDGRLDDDQVAQLARCRSFARVLASGDAKALRGLDLPGVPPGDRGRLLGEMIGAAGGASSEGLDFCLDAARAAWPDAFRPGSAGLDTLARPLASALAPLASNPPAWFDRVRQVLDRLGSPGFEPDGLAAEIVAEAARIAPGSADPWRIRAFLLARDDAWRALFADARRDLAGPEPIENLAAFRRWDENLTRNSRSMQILLNAASAEALARIVRARADDRSESRWADELKAMGAVSWWDHPAGAIDDIRERFAREIPLAPLDPDALPVIRRWLGPETSARRSIEEADESGLVPLDVAPAPGPRKVAEVEPLSPIGAARWSVLNALTILDRPGIDGEGRWRQIAGWADGDLPAGRLSVEDRRRLVAWLIFRADYWDDRDLPAVSAWLRREGLDSAEEVGRWKAWCRELDGLAPAGDLDAARVFRVEFVGALREAMRGG